LGLVAGGSVKKVSLFLAEGVTVGKGGGRLAPLDLAGQFRPRARYRRQALLCHPLSLAHLSAQGAELRRIGNLPERESIDQNSVHPETPDGHKIGATASTILNREHGWTVHQRHIPRIITFLGYSPIPCPEDPLKKLAWYKQDNGLTLLHPGEEMGRDPEQLADWLSGRHQPCRRNQEKIRLFLSGHVQGPAGDQNIGTN
jgi:hypothetical protein